MLAAGRHFDLIDAHYFYPDGVAAVRLGRHFGIPVCVTARGTDLSLIPDYPTPRRMIVDAAAHADGLITVCQALKDRLVELGRRRTASRSCATASIWNASGLSTGSEARAALGCTRRTLGSVGLLIERKGHHHIIQALASLPDTDLLIVGDGPERGVLERLAKTCGVADRVRFLGLVDQTRLASVYNAMDALVLASSREGWANVLLEAMACGTPVVASSVWGTPEVVAAPEAGVLMPSLDAPGVVAGVNRLFQAYPERSQTRRYAEGFSWEATTKGQLELFGRILNRPQPNRAA